MSASFGKTSMNMLGLKVMNDKMVVVAAGVPFVVTTNSSKPNEVQCVMANGEFSEKIEFGHVDTIQKLIEDLSQSSENSNGYSNGDNKLSIQVICSGKNGKGHEISGLETLTQWFENINKSQPSLKESMIKLKSGELKSLMCLMSEPYERENSSSTQSSSSPTDDADELGSTAEIEKSVYRSEKAYWASIDMLDNALVSLQENTAVTDNDLRHGTRLSQFQPFKSLHDANFANYENLVLTKLIVSVMDNRRFVTNVHKVKKTLKIPQLESKDTPNYLSDEDFMTNICYDTMLDQFQKTLCFHLGELARNFDPSKLSCHSVRWFDTQEVLEHSKLLDPYNDYNMPAMDAKKRPFNVVMLTEFANIIQVHCQNLVQSVYDTHSEKRSGTWLPLVECCCHYGIMLHDFLLTVDRTEVWKSLRKCVWLLVWFLKSHPLIHETLAKHYLNLPKPECEMSMLDISNDIFQYEHPRIPLGFGTNLQPFRFLHWFINPKLTPKFVENHIYLYDYIKHQLPSPRLARAWDAIEARHHNNSLQAAASTSSSTVDSSESANQHLATKDAFREALEIFIQVEHRKLTNIIGKCEEYICQLKITVLMFEVAYWLKKLFKEKKPYAPDAYYLCWRNFDDEKFFVPIACFDHAMRKQYCKREVIYYLLTRFCLNILHHEMIQNGEDPWDKSSMAFQTFVFLFRRLYMPHVDENSAVFAQNDSSYDRVSAKILSKMRAIMEREKQNENYINRGYHDLHMEDLTLFTNEATQMYVKLEMQVTVSLNDIILSSENQKQVDNFISRVLEALVSTSSDKNVEIIDWLFVGRCVPLYILDLYKLLAKNNLLGYPSVFAYSTKTFIDKFLHEKITKDKRTIDQFFTAVVYDDSRICPIDKVERNPFVTLAERFFKNDESRLMKNLSMPLLPSQSSGSSNMAASTSSSSGGGSTCTSTKCKNKKTSGQSSSQPSTSGSAATSNSVGDSKSSGGKNSQSSRCR